MDHIQYLQLEVSTFCNAKCPQCSRTTYDGELASFISEEHWDLSIIDNLELDKLSNLKLVALEGDNGDCMMHPRIEDIIAKFYNAPSKPFIFIVTNGSMRKPEFWKKLAERFNDRLSIQFSIDGTADTHELYRIGTSYDKVIENAKAFIAGGGTAQRRTIIFKHSEHELERIKQESIDIGFTRLNVIPCDDFRYFDYDKWPAYQNGTLTHYLEMPTKTDFTEYNYDFIPLEIKEQIRFRKNMQMYCPNFREGHIYVTYKGHIIPCCGYHADLYFDHRDNEQFREIFGDYNKTNLSVHTLSHILSQQDTLFDRMEANFKSDNVLPKCIGCNKYSPPE